MKMPAFLLFCLCFARPAGAQVDELRIGVDGLTCSQCTRSVEVKLRQLSFVRDVQMDLANARGVVYLKQDRQLAPAAVAKAVRDAGFSMRFLSVVLRNPGAQPSGGNCLAISGLNFRLIGALPSGNAGTWILQLQGAPYGGKKKAAIIPDSCGRNAIPAIVLAE